MNVYDGLHDAVAKTAQGDVAVRYSKYDILREDCYVLLKDGRLVYIDSFWPNRREPKECYILYEDANACDIEEMISVDEVEGRIVEPHAYNG